MSNERKLEIENAAKSYLQKWDGSILNAYIQGAVWAYDHPRKVYVVVRCDEHSDYVEKVFVDNDKAVDYCNKFNSSTSDEYCRVIEEMEVTL